ncbi:peptidase S6 [Mannheimia granulomatis]|uniref:S6 family peptidase n=1 Tax=Mannheimia granulomatis TaxID=85402 RepID=UPI00159D29FD|nr:S6 family peptidase [Mannheimia granulomatis]QLB15810.1 peptidase S6 [Mannheimia granulomatis]
MNKLTKKFNLSYIASALAITFVLPAYASIVRNDVDYQYFRDFAENKGKFTVGASNIEIKDKDGNSLGYMMNNNMPMPDFSAASRVAGIATLINPQYAVSVAHNTGLSQMEFGAAGENPDAHYYKYQVVDRNDYGKVENGLHPDYQVPRLNKLVTEVAPTLVTDLGNKAATYQDTSRFSDFVRLGGGRQQVRGRDDVNQQLASSYQFLTGGAQLALLKNASDYWLDFSGSLYNSPYGPLAAYGTRGDSGSGVYAYDKKENRWLLVGLHTFGHANDGPYGRSGIMREAFHNTKFAEDIAATLDNDKENTVFNWVAQGKESVISSATQQFVVPLADRSIQDNSNSPLGYKDVRQVLLPQENNGKSLHIEGKDSTIVLKTNINQGAGALNFNANVTVRPENDQTWLGAGITVAPNKQVTWQVKNPQGDRLSKLGKGTLHINGSGENLGDISVGEGTVILNQQVQNGKKQAFNKVGIVSGRSTVVLNSADQVNPNNIYFGFRGGRLDLNGNSITFNRLQNTDDGARIVNNANSAATLTLSPKKFSEEDLKWGEWKKTGGDIYEYVNTHRNSRKEYFRLIGRAAAYFPTNSTSSADWEFLSLSKSEAVKKVLSEKNSLPTYNTFNGFIGETDSSKHNGQMNVVYDPQATAPLATASSITWGKGLVAGADIYQFTNKQDGIRDYFALKGNPKNAIPTNHQSNADWEYLSSNKQEAIAKMVTRKNAPLEEEQLNGMYLLSGGLNLNGDLMLKGGKLLLSGRPTPHAYDAFKKQDVVYEDDWQNRQFNANNIVANNKSHLYVGRNVASVAANFIATDNAQLHLGFINGKSPSCYYSEYRGATNCLQQAVISEQNFANLPTTQISGNVNLAQNSQLNLGKANLNGTIQAAPTTSIHLANQATWTNNGDSRIGNLVTENGSTITLNERFASGELPARFNKLIIDGNFSGNVKINYLTNIVSGQGDHVQVNGIAEGTLTLALRNSGKEVNEVSPLSLLTLTHREQAEKASVSLENGYVDLGAYRYVLANRSNDYRLYNPLKDAQNRNTSIAAATVQLNDAIKAAEQQRQEVTRLEAEIATQRQAEQAAKQAVTTAQTKLNEANAELSRLQQYVDYYSRYYPYYARQMQGQITTAKQKVTQATTALNNANNTANSAAERLKQAEQAVASAQNVADRTEASLSGLRANVEAAKAGLKGEMLQLCQESGANCEHLQINGDTGVVEAISQSDWVSQYANTALSELSAQANSALQIGNGLDRQLFTHSDKLHVWSSLEHQKTEHKSNLYRAYEQQTNLTQVGVEMPLANGFTAGAVLSKNHANAEFDEGVTGKSNLLMATLYGKWQSENGTFISLDGSYGKAKNRIDLFGENRFNRHISAVGANIGHEFDFAGVKLQPSVGARYYRLSGKQYNLGEVEVNSPTVNFMTYQAGVKVSKAFAFADWRVEPSLAAHYVDANSKHLNVAVNGNDFEQRFGRYVKTEAGVAFARNQWQVAVNAGFLKGNEIQKQRFAGVKIGYQW